MKINYKCLMYSIKYVFFPTLTFCMLLFLYFLDFKIVFDFIISKEGFSPFIRVLLLITEVLFVYIIYKKNLKNFINIEEWEDLGTFDHSDSSRKFHYQFNYKFYKKGACFYIISEKR